MAIRRPDNEDSRDLFGVNIRPNRAKYNNLRFVTLTDENAPSLLSARELSIVAAMATFSDGQFFSPSSNGLKDSVSSVVSTGDMRQHLQNLLDTKDRQVQQVATLGERVLQQRMELEEKIYQLRDLDVQCVHGGPTQEQGR